MPLFLAALTVLIACYTAYWRVRFRMMGRKKRKVLFPLPITPFDPAFLNNYLKYPQNMIANDWGRSSSLNVNIEEMID